ncbi:MAG TPA: class I SAM-dependent methyltransferase [Gemmatimonadales bacterium]|nr:class I SAM-dependent methyltransferase [Gemmatimonadales bacterium]
MDREAPRTGLGAVAFEDHFSGIATAYARARPSYPAALFAALAALAPGRDLAWDAGTGNGQAAHGLAAHFRAVVATDPSANQLAAAPPHSRIAFRLGSEAASGLPAGSVDLVTAAQAAHWFAIDAFYAEARRVLRPRGVIALWCYDLCRIAPPIDASLAAFYERTVGPYWPTARHLVVSRYRTLAFPFREVPFPSLLVEQWWTLAEFAAYVRTWSAVTRFIAARGFDPVAALLDEIAAAWGAPATPRRVSWPLAGRIGRR